MHPYEIYKKVSKNLGNFCIQLLREIIYASEFIIEDYNNWNNFSSTSDTSKREYTKWKIYFYRKEFLSNQFFSNFFSKNVTFTYIHMYVHNFQIVEYLDQLFLWNWRIEHIFIALHRPIIFFKMMEIQQFLLLCILWKNVKITLTQKKIRETNSSKFFSNHVTFTKFLPKKCESKFLVMGRTMFEVRCSIVRSQK